MITNQELFDLKESIEEKKNELAELEGRKKYLMKQLKEKWNCSNIQQAGKFIKDETNKINEIKNKEEVIKQEIEDNYEL